MGPQTGESLIGGLVIEPAALCALQLRGELDQAPTRTRSRTPTTKRRARRTKRGRSRWTRRAPLLRRHILLGPAGRNSCVPFARADKFLKFL
jgi:hypothetical protein